MGGGDFQKGNGNSNPDSSRFGIANILQKIDEFERTLAISWK
jgi:hypothetical protein